MLAIVLGEGKDDVDRGRNGNINVNTCTWNMGLFKNFWIAFYGITRSALQERQTVNIGAYGSRTELRGSQQCSVKNLTLPNPQFT